MAYIRYYLKEIALMPFMFSFFRFLESIPVVAIGYFRESAERLIEERGAVDALAAALAHISGATALQQRSLLSSDVVSLSHTSGCRESNGRILFQCCHLNASAHNAHVTGSCCFQGFTTMQMTCSMEMHNMGYAWKTLKEQLGEEIESHIHRMTFIKGKTVCDACLIVI